MAGLDTLGRVGENLAALVARDRVPPSVLFEGADEGALVEAARQFAASILARETDAASAARVERQVMVGDHPDVEIQSRDKATVISVAALSALLARAHQTPMASTRRVFIIHPADAMDPGGIARYLKVLEEPPRHAVFILVTAHPDRLPDAVRSRCQRFRFPPLDEDALRRQLAATPEVSAERAARAARLASGSWSRARRLAGEETLDALDALLACGKDGGRDAVGVVDGVLTRMEAAAKSAAEDDETPARARTRLRDMLVDLLHALCVMTRDAMVMTDERLPSWITPAQAERLFVSWSALAVDVRRNVTPRILLLALVDALAGPA